MGATSHLQLYPFEEPVYLPDAQVVPKFTHEFVNLTILWLFLFFLVEHGK